MIERKVVDYIVVVESDYKELQDEVMEKIDEGYLLQGGICVTDTVYASVEDGFDDKRYQSWYYQAMVKYEDTKQ